jgi:hypothetical protein
LVGGAFLLAGLSSVRVFGARGILRRDGVINPSPGGRATDLIKIYVFSSLIALRGLQGRPLQGSSLLARRIVFDPIAGRHDVS